MTDPRLKAAYVLTGRGKGLPGRAKEKSRSHNFVPTLQPTAVIELTNRLDFDDRRLFPSIKS